MTTRLQSCRSSAIQLNLLFVAAANDHDNDEKILQKSVGSRLNSDQVFITCNFRISYNSNVGRCPTWWSPCRTQVAPSVQRRKVWL